MVSIDKINDNEKLIVEILTMIDDKLAPENSPETENIEEIIGYGMDLANLAGNSAKALADSKEILYQRELIFMQSNEHLWDRPTILKKMMDGTLATQHKNCIWADRINAAIAHKLEFYRTIVSKYKEEMKISAMQQFNNRQ